MKRSLLFLGILSLTAGVEASAADLSWGDPTLDSGQFKVSGAVRSRYLHKIMWLMQMKVLKMMTGD